MVFPWIPFLMDIDVEPCLESTSTIIRSNASLAVATYNDEYNIKGAKSVYVILDIQSGAGTVNVQIYDTARSSWSSSVQTISNGVNLLSPLIYATSGLVRFQTIISSTADFSLTIISNKECTV
jgi:hypothetical protein